MNSKENKAERLRAANKISRQKKKTHRLEVEATIEMIREELRIQQQCNAHLKSKIAQKKLELAAHENFSFTPNENF